MFETMEIIDKKKISTEGIIFKQERYTREVERENIGSSKAIVDTRN